MDISDSLVPKSDQLDAVDLLSGPRTFRIERVSKGSAEQPVNIHLAGFPRPWRPSKGMRRVLVGIWGKDASLYADHDLTLFCDTTVKFGGIDVGGVRISHMSHIDERKKVPMIVGRGKGGVWTVDPLTESALTAPTALNPDRARLVAEWNDADDARKKVIEAEVAAIDAKDAD